MTVFVMHDNLTAFDHVKPVKVLAQHINRRTGRIGPEHRLAP